jgi:short-subunit dehydrogenase
MKNNNTIVITGTGFKTFGVLRDNENIFSSKNVKINIGTAAAKLLAEKGYELLILSKTSQKLDRIKRDLTKTVKSAKIRTYVLDILDEVDVKKFFEKLNKKKKYSYIHSAGLSTGTYNLKDDNPYLSIEDIPIDLPVIEFETVIKSILLMIKGFLPFFEKQKLSKVIVVNSMSGIRAYPLGFSHSSAKGGLHNAIRSLSLELNKKNINFSEIMPGIVDTGLYDTKAVIKAVKRIGLEFGYKYDKIPKMSPYCVAEAILLCLTSTANILSVNMVSQGQWTHQSA